MLPVRMFDVIILTVVMLAVRAPKVDAFETSAFEVVVTFI